VVLLDPEYERKRVKVGSCERDDSGYEGLKSAVKRVINDVFLSWENLQGFYL
jgi:hypothetical protein